MSRRTPKKRRRKDIEAALKMIIYPPVIVLGLIHNYKRKENGKKNGSKNGNSRCN